MFSLSPDEGKELIFIDSGYVPGLLHPETQVSTPRQPCKGALATHNLHRMQRAQNTIRLSSHRLTEAQPPGPDCQLLWQREGAENEAPCSTPPHAGAPRALCSPQLPEGDPRVPTCSAFCDTAPPTISIQQIKSSTLAEGTYKLPWREFWEWIIYENVQSVLMVKEDKNTNWYWKILSSKNSKVGCQLPLLDPP